MSYLKLSRTHEIGVEIHAECKGCGMPLLSEAALGPSSWGPSVSGQGTHIEVKVAPCARCARNAEIAGSTIHREG